jgi:hypothetical protein
MAYNSPRLRLVKDAIDGVQENTGALAHSAAERLEDAAGEIARYARVATDCMEEWGKEARDSMQRAPVLWSAMSLGAIALIGLGATIVTRSRIERERRRKRAAAAALRRRTARPQKKTTRHVNGAQATP